MGENGFSIVKFENNMKGKAQHPLRSGSKLRQSSIDLEMQKLQNFEPSEASAQQTIPTDANQDENTPFNEVYVWGDDSAGQLGLCGLFPESVISHATPKICSFNVIIKSIACGFKHSLFVSESGHVYAMGSNSHGQLGLGNAGIKGKNTPTLVEAQPMVDSVVTKVACGLFHSLALTESGQAYSWGNGKFGALG